MDASPHSRRGISIDRPLTRRIGLLVCVTVFLVSGGCGTTRWTDSTRTATEQLLITDAIDDAVGRLNLDVLAGRDVYFDPQYLEGTVDKNYLVSSLRQHLLASGCILRESREEATFVVEARSGAVGTDRHDVMIGVPSVNVPTFLPTPLALPASIPEIPLAKNTKQRGVVKLGVFAYNRKTGRRVWQSGIEPVASFAKDSWLLGAGPFRKSTIDEGTSFVGDALPLVGEKQNEEQKNSDKQIRVSLVAEQIFRDGFAVPVPGADTQLATHTSDVPPVNEAPPASQALSTDELSASQSEPPAMLPELGGPMAPIGAPSSPQSLTTNAPSDPRFAPRPTLPVVASVEAPTGKTTDAPVEKHQRDVAETSSPLERLWPGNWFKRNGSHGGQAAD